MTNRHGIRRRGAIALLVLVSVLSVGVAPASADHDVEHRIAQFWQRVDSMQPGAFLSSADLGQWALNVIERNPRARITVTDFRSSTGEMQAGMDRAGLAPVAVTPTAPATGNVEQRIADFWKRVDALWPDDFISAADIGQWALNVIERNPRARITVTDFRSSTGAMQAGMDRAGLVLVGGIAPPPPPPVVTAPPAPSGFNPYTYIGQGDAYNCGHFASQANAQAVLRADPRDPNRLDANWNGLACEANPAPYDWTPVPR